MPVQMPLSQVTTQAFTFCYSSSAVVFRKLSGLPLANTVFVVNLRTGIATSIISLDKLVYIVECEPTGKFIYEDVKYDQD